MRLFTCFRNFFFAFRVYFCCLLVYNLAKLSTVFCRFLAFFRLICRFFTLGVWERSRVIHIFLCFFVDILLLIHILENCCLSFRFMCVFSSHFCIIRQSSINWLWIIFYTFIPCFFVLLYKMLITFKKAALVKRAAFYALLPFIKTTRASSRWGCDCKEVLRSSCC